jgi:formyltetrahydrofolate synthetase
MNRWSGKGTYEGADGVTYSPEVNSVGTCMVKTHLSLSHDPAVRGRPRGEPLSSAVRR